jgi:DnaK suppressor protein
LSKTPAPKAAQKKPAGKAKPPAGTAAKTTPKTAATKPVAPKPAAKAPHAAAKPAPKAPAHASQPAPKPSNKPAAKPTVKTIAPTTKEVKPVAPAAHAGTAPKPAAPAAPVPAAAAKKAPARHSGKAAAIAPAQAPLPAPTSRFADRFAPPRPPTRQMNNLELDTPRQTHTHDPKLANAWKAKAGRDLTEAEVLAMPDSEYMNEKQLEFFRHTLQRLKDDLLNNAGETTEHLREDTSIVPDPADRATIEEEHALELRTRDRERKLLKKISQSLGRIESGDYGFCDETGEPIGLGRLIARPTATLSLEAQQRRELKQKMFGD